MLMRYRMAWHLVVVGAMACGSAAWAQDEADDAADAPPPETTDDYEGVPTAETDPRLGPGRYVDEDWFLLGRFGTVRSDLLEAGITFDINWTQSFMSVANGGTTCEDPPGVREGPAGRLYLAYLRDPSGNKICALHRMG